MSLSCHFKGKKETQIYANQQVKKKSGYFHYMNTAKIGQSKQNLPHTDLQAAIESAGDASDKLQIKY